MIRMNEKEMRNVTKETIESFEHWSRRIINDKFSEKYGKDYFDYEFDNGEKLIKNSIIKTITDRMKEEPQRYPRKIDAILIDDISYFLCKDNFYKEFFKDVLEKFFSCQDEIRNRLEIIKNVRNKLNHGNPISYRESEMTICYSHDFIDCYQNYYVEIGKEQDYNVPFFTKVADSQGRCAYRDTNTLNQLNLGVMEKSLRPGDVYKIWVEVDANFPESFYEITWHMCDRIVAKGKEFTFVPTIDMVSNFLLVSCSLRTTRKWHKHAGSDDGFTICIGKILPPIEDLY